MRNLSKNPQPRVLKDNSEIWLKDYLADKNNKTKKYRYRDPDIKRELKEETSYKCIYCESKIGHNCPGDVEHKVPSSVDPSLHYTWDNLTIACPECNRRKNDFYKGSSGERFLDPYQDDVEALLQHLGPLVFASPGELDAETTVLILELDSYEKRGHLIKQKIERIRGVVQLCNRYVKATEDSERELVKLLLRREVERGREFSMAVLSVIEKQVPHVLE